MEKTLMTLQHLNVFAKNAPERKLVDDVSMTIPEGQVVGIVGESGSGKSLTMRSLMKLLPDNLESQYEDFCFDGKAVTADTILPISMIFQDPMTSLNPLRTIGFHLLEVVQRFQGLNKEQGSQVAIDMLKKVGLSQPELRMNQFPFELSGGMRQRIMIAMALLAKPRVLIADEPTTALDVTIQMQILSLLLELQEELDLTVVIVSHDFGVIAAMCDQVKVMYQGQVVEEGRVEEIFHSPQHAYTKRLLRLANFNVEPVQDKLDIGPDTKLVELTPSHKVRREA